MHGPSSDWGEDKSVKFKTRIGIFLFIIYGLIYAGFICINSINPGLMGKIIFSGLNLAIVYGFGLIILAIILGVLYNHICTKKENEMNSDKGDKKWEQSFRQSVIV